MTSQISPLKRRRIFYAAAAKKERCFRLKAPDSAAQAIGSISFAETDTMKAPSPQNANIMIRYLLMKDADMKTIDDYLDSINAKEMFNTMKIKRGLPYEAKVKHAEVRAREFYDRLDGRCHVSVGGLDSITLLIFLRSIGINVPAISVSALEDASIIRIHKQLGVIMLAPLMTKTDVIRKFGFPVISKEIAGKIELLQNPTEKNATVRHAIITGETGEYGGFRKNTRMKLSDKWLRKFAGNENQKEGCDYCCAPFKVSQKCCYYLKEKPCDDYAKKNGSSPYLGLMASEHGRREKVLMRTGCNYYGKTVTRSAPFAIFSRQDILQLALDLNVPVPEIYGEIRRDVSGNLYTTKAQRTGCDMCGFGITFEKRPHRFDRLRERNPIAWKYWMYDVGWGKVLDYIGISWENTPYTLQIDF
ncbi:MAG: hypothetical protein LBQ97_02490 [Fusobacteriaceae bacterium]|jgi:hypothetical protein|nr:hypothetical protein [Fusobacteriaceae bacterium]